MQPVFIGGAYKQVCLKAVTCPGFFDQLIIFALHTLYVMDLLPFIGWQ